MDALDERCKRRNGHEIRELECKEVRFKIFTVVTMKNVIFWDIRAQFLLHRRHIRLRYRIQPVHAM
jgi:hypothetical protein